MDDIRFDALTRRLSSATTRRGLFRLLAGAAFAGAFGPPGAAVAADCATPCGDGHLSPIVCCRSDEICLQQLSCCPSDRVCAIASGIVDCCADGFRCVTVGQDGSRDCVATAP